MFDWLKKQNAAPVAPDPEAEKLAAKLKEEKEIADLQSQLNHQKAERDRAETARDNLTKDIDDLMEQICKAKSKAEQKRLAEQVQEKNEELEEVTDALTIARDNIRKNRQVLREKHNIQLAEEGNVKNVVDLKRHAEELQQVGQKAQETGIEMDIAKEANDKLLGGYQKHGEPQSLENIIAVALNRASVRTEPEKGRESDGQVQVPHPHLP